MNKKELINKTVSVLKENNARKHVPQQKTTLHISDDNGQKKDFIIKKDSTDLLYTTKDVTEMFEAAIAIIEDSLKHGEEVNIHGFGTFSLKLRAARETKHPETGEVCVVKARYVPKFHFGNKLRMAAKIYELGLDAKEDDK
ncbi:dNA-binding protein HU [Clostridium sp. CAG:678]|jgi:DNA-binding protein HU-beta|nr:dNA-binding protein HU [Clostridium sp. CAG:678]